MVMKQAELPGNEQRFGLGTAVRLLTGWIQLNGIVQRVMAHQGRVMTTLTFVTPESQTPLSVVVVFGNPVEIQHAAATALWRMVREGYSLHWRGFESDANEINVNNEIRCDIRG